MVVDLVRTIWRFNRYFKTFTLLKINDTNCKIFDLSNKLDMINTARLLLSCATNQEPNLLEKRSYLKINDRLVEY